MKTKEQKLAAIEAQICAVQLDATEQLRKLHNQKFKLLKEQEKALEDATATIAVVVPSVTDETDAPPKVRFCDLDFEQKDILSLLKRRGVFSGPLFLSADSEIAVALALEKQGLVLVDRVSFGVEVTITQKGQDLR
jgi:hypothetical protein